MRSLHGVQLTKSQQAIVIHDAGPARILGSYASGKTTALRARAERLAGAIGGDRILVLCRSASAARSFRFGATTVWALAVDIMRRHDRARHLLDRDAQRGIVGALLAAEPRRWPLLAPAAHDGALLDEVADAVCRYQASWLGVEELRTHAAAAGDADPWEELVDLTRAYRDELDRAASVDWAGALVGAGLLLRDPAVAAAERARFDHLMVDDFEQTSFAAHRLLASLAGPGGNVVVAGNLDAPVPAVAAGDRRWLERFARSYGARVDVTLDQRLAPMASTEVIVADARDEAAAALLDAHHRGVPWNAMAVVVASEEHDPQGVLDGLRERAVVAAAGEGVDPWIAPAEPATPATPPDDAVTVTSVEGTAGRTWPLVVVAGAIGGAFRPPLLLDAELFNGPDVPSDEKRAEQWRAEQRRRAEQVASTATERLVLLDGQMAV